MRGPRAGALREVVQFRRASVTDDGLGEVKTWADLGQSQRGRKVDASDAETWTAGEVGASISARFVLRRNALTESITAKDRLTCRGLEYEITGKRELADDVRFFEFSTVTRGDRT